MNDIFYQDINPKAQNVILLIHGLGVNGTSWQYQINDLKNAGFRLIIPDLLGFGYSKYHNEEISILNSCRDIWQIIEHLEIKHLSIIGLSLGGVIAMQLAYMHPEVVQKLVVINSFAKLPLDSLKQRLYFKFRFLIAKLLPVKLQALFIGGSLFPNDQKLKNEFYQQMRLAHKIAYRKYLDALIALNLSDDLQKISAQTLLISTSGDKIIPKSCAEILAKNINQAKLIELKGSHAAIADNANDINKALLEFLQ